MLRADAQRSTGCLPRTAGRAPGRENAVAPVAFEKFCWLVLDNLQPLTKLPSRFRFGSWQTPGPIRTSFAALDSEEDA
jgi:hypothetical protein